MLGTWFPWTPSVHTLKLFKATRGGLARSLVGFFHTWLITERTASKMLHREEEKEENGGIVALLIVQRGVK